MSVGAGCSITCALIMQLQPRGVVRGVLDVTITEFALTLARSLTYTMIEHQRQPLTGKEDGFSTEKCPYPTKYKEVK
jgi:hypothetical protein